MLTIAERAAAYNATFAKWPASGLVGGREQPLHLAPEIVDRLLDIAREATVDNIDDVHRRIHDTLFNPGTEIPVWAATESGHDVLYGIWLIGATWGNLTPFYGSYPRSYLDRVMALFPDIVEEANALAPTPDAPWPTLHAFSGSLPPGPYFRLDLRHDPAQGVIPDVTGNVYDALVWFPHRAFKLICADPPYTDADAAKYQTPSLNRAKAVAALAHVCQPGGHMVWLDQTWPIHSANTWRTVGRIALIRSTNHRIRLVSIFERV